MPRFNIEAFIKVKGAKKGAGDIRAYSRASEMAAKGTKQLKGATSKLGKTIVTISPMAAAAGAALAAMAAKKTVDAFIQQENAISQLNASLQSTEGQAGMTSKQLQAMAKDLQDITTFGDEATIAGQSMLLTFKQIRGDEFARATSVAQDLAVKMQTDLKSAIVQVGKALNDPVSSLGELSRAGIQFTDQQKEVIAALWESGRAAEAQRIVLAELESQFGGSAEAARNTLGGALQNLKNQWGDLMEVIGGSGSTALRFWIDKIAGGIQAVVENWGALRSAVNETLASIIRAIGPFVADLLRAWKPYFEGLNKAWNALPMVDSNLVDVSGLEKLARKIEETSQLAAEGFEQKAAEALEAYSETVDQASVSTDGIREELLKLEDQAGETGEAIREKLHSRVKELREDIEVLRTLLGKVTDDAQRALVEADIARTDHMDLSLQLDPDQIRAQIGATSKEAMDEMNKEIKEGTSRLQEQFEKDMRKIRDTFIENVQGALADAIEDFIRTGELSFESLWKSFVDFAIKAIAQVVAEWLTAQAIMAAASVIGGGGGTSASVTGSLTGTVSQGSVTKALSGVSASTWVAIFGTAAFAAAAIHIASRAIAMGKDRSFARAGSVGVRGGEAFGEGRFGQRGDQSIKAIQDWLDEFERVTGGIVESMARIHVEFQREGELVRIQIGRFVENLGGGLIFGDLQSALADGLRRALGGADFSGLSDVWDPFVEALERQAFGSLEEIMEFARLFAEIDQQSMSPVTVQIREMQAQWDVLRDKLAEVGIGAVALADTMARGWKSIRDSITGTTKSAKQLFEERRKAFNAEIERERRKQEAALKSAKASRTAAKAEIARLEAMIAGAKAAGPIMEDLLAKWSRMLGQARRSLAEATGAIRDAEAALAGLPDPIGPGEFGGGVGGTSPFENLQEEMDRITRSLMPELARGLAELAIKYEKLTEQAGDNAEALERLNRLREEEEQQLRDTAVEDFYSRLTDFEQAGPAADVFGPLREIGDQADKLVEDFLNFSDAMGFSEERIQRVLDRIEAAEQRRIDMLSQQVHVDLLGGLANLIENESLRHRLLMEQVRIRFILETEQMRAQFALLVEMGRLTQAQIDLLQEAFDWIDANVDTIIETQVPQRASFNRGQRGLRDVGRAAEEMARRLESARKGIREFLLDLQTGQFGGRSSREQFEAALSQFRELASQPRNIQALENFPDVARRLLDIARERFASGEEFQRILAMVEGTGIDFLGTQQVTQDNVVFDQRFLDQQRQHVEATREGSASIASVNTRGFTALSDELGRLNQTQVRTLERITALEQETRRRRQNEERQVS